MSYFEDFPYADNPIHELVMQQFKVVQEREFELIEACCWLSLHDPRRRGVLIRRYGPAFEGIKYVGDDMTIMATNRMTVELDEGVPWLTIHDQKMTEGDPI